MSPKTERPAKKLADYSTIDREANVERLEDIEGVPVTVKAFRLSRGEFGEYAFIDVVDAAGELHTVATGGVYILDALKNAAANHALPCDATFVKSGRAWVIE